MTSLRDGQEPTNDASPSEKLFEEELEMALRMTDMITDQLEEEVVILGRKTCLRIL